MARKKHQSQDERAVRRLLRRYIKRRDWDMVNAMFFELGIIWEEEHHDGANGSR